MTTRGKRGRSSRIVAGAALVLGAPILLASPAHAVGATIQLSPGALTPVVANLGHSTVTDAATAYGMKVASGVSALGGDLKLSVTQAPANGKLAVEKVANAGAATTAFTETAAGSVANLGTAAANDIIYLTGNVPGTYTAKLFQDSLIAPNNAIDSSEPVSDPITLTVADAGGPGTTSDPSDDVKLSLSAAPSVNVGATIPASIGYTPALSMSDARGDGADGLGAALSKLTVVDVPGIAGLTAQTDAPTSYSPSTGVTFTTGVASLPGLVNLRADLVPALTNGDDDSTTSFAQQVVDVLQGAVSGLTSTSLDISPADGQSGTLKQVTPQRILAKAGTTTEKFVGDLDDSASSVANQSMMFGLVPGVGTLLKDLKANGLSLPLTGLVPTTTDSDGSAGITVGAKGTAGSSYYLTATSNGVAADLDPSIPGSQPLVVTFANPVPSALSASGDLAQAAGGTATVAGTVLDQWGNAVAPAAGSAATLQLLRGDGSAAITKKIPIGSDGSYSTTISDLAGNVTNRVDTYTMSLGDLKTAPASISWGGPSGDGQVSLDGIGSVSTVPVPDGTSFAVAVAPDASALPSAVSAATNAVKVTGQVLDADGTPSVAPFLLKATDGTYFLDAAGLAHKTFVGVTNSAGQITDGTSTGVRALFTKSGDAAISLLSGAASDSSGTFTVASPLATSDVSVVLDPVTVEPGASTPVTAHVLDGFGNAVPGVSVGLSVPDDASGELADGASNLVTDATGTVSSVLSAADDATGPIQVTATINGGSADPSAVSNLLGTGLAVAKGAHTAVQSAAVSATQLALSAPTAVSGLGKAVVTGTAPASSLVNVYAKRIGDSGYKFLQSVSTDSDGNWRLSTPLTRTTTFLAKAGDVTSSTDTTVLNSVADVTSKALGDGKVRLTIDGQPDVPGTVDVSLGGKSLAKGVKTDADGDKTLTVKAPKGKRVFKVLFRSTGATPKSTDESALVR